MVVCAGRVAGSPVPIAGAIVVHSSRREASNASASYVYNNVAMALTSAMRPLANRRWKQPTLCVVFQRRLVGDPGYDAAAIRRGLRARHIVPWLAMRRTAVAWVSGVGSSSARFPG